MKVYKVKGIILRQMNLGEADKILTVFTSNLGKIRVVAKGIRRPDSKLGGHLELFTLSQILLAKGRNLDVVISADTLDSFKGIKHNLKKLALTYYIAELVDRLISEEYKDTRIFNLIIQAFKQIKSSLPVPTILFLISKIFEINLLKFLGYSPELKKCVHCGRTLDDFTKELFFSSSLGGILCFNCRNLDKIAVKISRKAVKTLNLLQKEQFSFLELDFEDKIFKEAGVVLNIYLKYIAQRELNSSYFLRNFV